MKAMRLRLVRVPAPPWVSILIPPAAVLVTFLIAGILIRLAGAPILATLEAVVIDPLQSRSGILEVLVKTTPYLLCGVAVAFAVAGGYWNIGAEGQLYAGAVAAAWLGTLVGGVPTPIAVPIVLLGSAVAGLLWAIPPAILRARFGIDEVVTTLLLNPVMLFIVSGLLNGPWRDPQSMWPQSPLIADSAQLPKLIGQSRLHLGFLLAVLTLVAFWWILTQTRIGLEMRAVRAQPRSARFVGISVERVVLRSALVSGALAGLAGGVELAGIHHRLIEALSPGYGYSGIIVAMLGGLHAAGVGFAALFFGLIGTGAQTASRLLNVPTYLGDVIQATLLLVLLVLLLLRSYALRVEWR